MHSIAARPARPTGRRLALLGVLLTSLTGCVVVVGSPLGFMDQGPAPLEEVTVDGEGRDKVLLVDVQGVISEQPSRRAFGLVEEESMLARIEAELAAAEDDRRIRAVVLHVRSPGGSVTASDDVYRALRRFAVEREVPMVAALGGLATSGGYYVACAADHIVAHPASVTGSIGVILMSLNLEGLLAKLGIEDATVKAGRHKDMLSPLRTADETERAIANDVLAALHARFVDVVRERRPGIREPDLPVVTDGRIMDAATAVDLGLADEIGDLHAAVGVARRLIDAPDARVVRYRRAGEATETIHAAWRAPRPATGPAWAGLLEPRTDVGPRFLYLWAPPVDLTGLGGPR